MFPFHIQARRGPPDLSTNVRLLLASIVFFSAVFPLPGQEAPQSSPPFTQSPEEKKTSPALPPEIARLLSQASSGDAASAFALFSYYAREANQKEALRWLEASAQAGYPAAIRKLAELYEEGSGGKPRDLTRALSFYEEAARKGDRVALGCWLKLASRNPGSVDRWQLLAWSWVAQSVHLSSPSLPEISLPSVLFPPQLAKIRKEYAMLLSALAQQDDPKAALALGKAYWEGIGVSVDRKEAVRLWEKAAQQGEPEAQWRLGLAYAEGVGVKEDLLQATRWLLLAERKESLPPIARKTLERLRNRLAPRDLETLQSQLEELSQARSAVGLTSQPLVAQQKESRLLSSAASLTPSSSPQSYPSNRITTSRPDTPSRPAPKELTRPNHDESPNQVARNSLKESSNLSQSEPAKQGFGSILERCSQWWAQAQSLLKLWLANKDVPFPLFWTLTCTLVAVVLALLAWLLPGSPSARFLEESSLPGKKDAKSSFTETTAPPSESIPKTGSMECFSPTEPLPNQHTLAASPVQQRLWHALARQGVTLLDHPQELETHLPSSPKHQLEREALLAVARSGLLQELKVHPATKPVPPEWIRMLEQKQGLARPWAFWAIETWLWALATALEKGATKQEDDSSF